MKTRRGNGAGVVGSLSVCGCRRKKTRIEGYVKRVVVYDLNSEYLLSSGGSPSIIH
jgi:hypothetical protein